MIGATFLRPRTLDEACAILADHSKKGARAVLLAGGTDLVVETHLAEPKSTVPPPRTLVDVSSLPELAVIEVHGDVVRLGGGVTYLTLRNEPRLSQRFPLLSAMAKDVGALQIQARGTLAGNLATASPAADGVCALAAYRTTIGLRSVRGERTVFLDDFYTGYKRTLRADDEVIAWVELAVPKPPSRWYWRKVGTRLAQAISKVAVASVAELDGDVVRTIRFGVASVAATTALLPNVRRAIEGKPVAAVDLREVMAALDADIKPIDDVRSTGRYRMHVARALVRDVIGNLS